MKKMRKILAATLCLALALTLCACGGGSTTTNLMFGTGGETGTYYAYGGVLAQYVSSNTDVSITHVTSGGSKANIEDIAAEANQLGFVQSDVMSYAYTGTNLFEEAVEGFSTVAAMYMEQVQIITLNPEIKSVADLEGKIVSIGALGSGVYFNAIDILGVYGLSESDIEPVYQSFGDSVESLQDGKIDAAFIVAGAPTNAVTSLATTNDVYLVSLDEQHIADLIEVSPYYAKATIPADVYGTAEDVNCVAITALLICTNDLDENLVYEMTKALFEQEGILTHAKAAEITIESAFDGVGDLPLHPGAARYYQEIGVITAE